MNIEWLIVHHTAVSREQNPEQFDAVKRYHIDKGWGDIGYHFLIEPDGEVKTGRSEETEGAHTIGYNDKSLGICLSGNFDIQEPTIGQMEALRGLLERLMVKYKVERENIVPHRTFANKTCYGSKLTDVWARDLTSIKNNMIFYKEKNNSAIYQLGADGKYYPIITGELFKKLYGEFEDNEIIEKDYLDPKGHRLAMLDF